MTVREPHVTIEDCIKFVHQDENVDQMFELIHREIVEASPGRAENSGVAASIVGAIC